VLDHFCQHTEMRARSRCSHPRSTHAGRWYARRESILSASGSTHAPESVWALPAVPRPAAFRVPSPLRDAHRAVGLQEQRREHSTPLVIAPGARRVWRHSTNSTVTLRDRGPWVRALPRRRYSHRRARGALHWVDRAWMRARVARDRPRGREQRNPFGIRAHLPGVPLVLVMTARPTRLTIPRARIERTSALHHPQHPRDPTSAM
jgi:hypothetical protein